MHEDKPSVDLRYGTFEDSLFAALPEIKAKHDALQEDIGTEPLPYLAVGLVLKPFVKSLLSTNNVDKNLLGRVFAFLEEMARAQDIEVVNLLHLGIFESWVGERATLACAWKYMGASTKQIATNVAHRLSCGNNLPRTMR